MIPFEWTGTTAPWKQTQADIRRRVVVRPLSPLPRFVAGADCAFEDNGKTVRAAAVVYDRKAQAVVEERVARAPCTVPYVPGYLSFREAAAICDVIGKLKMPFGAVLFDGQGYAHPRRCGLACHVGVLLNVPAVGVAKSRLTGDHADVPLAAGAHVPLVDGGETVGVVLRTRDRVAPLFVSVGHRVDLASALELVLACRTKYRLPEPTRMADKLSKARPVPSPSTPGEG